jgi:hypothetical protein
MDARVARIHPTLSLSLSLSLSEPLRGTLRRHRVFAPHCDTFDGSIQDRKLHLVDGGRQLTLERCDRAQLKVQRRDDRRPPRRPCGLIRS